MFIYFAQINWRKGSDVRCSAVLLSVFDKKYILMMAVVGNSLWWPLGASLVEPRVSNTNQNNRGKVQSLGIIRGGRGGYYRGVDIKFVTALIDQEMNVEQLIPLYYLKGFSKSAFVKRGVKGFSMVNYVLIALIKMRSEAFWRLETDF